MRKHWRHRMKRFMDDNASMIQPSQLTKTSRVPIVAVTVTLPSGTDLSADPEGSAPSVKARDAGLARRIAERDGEALSDVVNAQFSRVFAVARRMVGNDADAEDIAQDVFLRLWRKPPDLSDERALLSTWLYRVAANLSIDRLRRKRPAPWTRRPRSRAEIRARTRRQPAIRWPGRSTPHWPVFRTVRGWRSL